MNKFLAMVFCLAMPIAVFAGDNGYKVTYDGGSIPNAKSGSDMKLFIDPNQVQLVRDKGEVVTIPAAAVTRLVMAKMSIGELGAAIGLAVVSLGIGALMALTKLKKHYVGLT